MLKAKLKEWVKRYLPLEIVATLTALTAAYGASLLTGSAVALAYAGTWGENLGYYTFAVIREMRAQLLNGEHEERPRLMHVQRAAGNLIFEFGAAELIDSFVSRPFFMYMGSVLLGNIGAGIVAGKIAADVVFYAIAILFYEIRKKRSR